MWIPDGRLLPVPVAELDDVDDESGEESADDDLEAAANATADSTVGFGLGIAFIALAATTLLAWRPSR